MKRRSGGETQSPADSKNGVESRRPTSLIDSAGLTPEDRLLLLAARWGISGTDDQLIERLVAQVRQWDYLLEAAEFPQPSPAFQVPFATTLTSLSEPAEFDRNDSSPSSATSRASLLEPMSAFLP